MGSPGPAPGSRRARWWCLAETQARVAGLAGGEGMVGRVIGDNALYQGLVGTVAETSAMVRAVRQGAEQVARVARLGGPEGDATGPMAVVGGLAALAHNATGAGNHEGRRALPKLW